MVEHLNVLRNQNSTPPQKLAAAESSSTHLDTLEQLRRASNQTYRDLRTTIRRLHRHLKRLNNVLKL